MEIEIIEDNVPFHRAIELCLQGYGITRNSWNVELASGNFTYVYNVSGKDLNNIASNFNPKNEVIDQFWISHIKNMAGPYMPTQCDMHANDWRVIMRPIYFQSISPR